MMPELFYSEIKEDEFNFLCSKYSNYLPISMLEKINRFVFDKDKKLCLIGKLLLLEKVLEADYSYLKLNDIQISKYGKPYFSDDSFYFNISHSGNFVVCGFSMVSEIGVDVEFIDSKIDINCFHKIFSVDEFEHIQNSINPVDQFYKFWTIKEAVLKSFGTGFSTNPVNVKLYLDDVYFKNEKINSITKKLDENHIYSLSSIEKLCDIKIRKIDFSDFNLLINKLKK